jgi:four helix bundle protein
MRPEMLRVRTKEFAVRVFQALPLKADAQILGKQLLRSGTSVAANYRAACRARSRVEFAAKVGVVLEEADETVFWLELLVESGIVPAAKLNDLLGEARELTAIFTASRETARKRSSQITRLPDFEITQLGE